MRAAGFIAGAVTQLEKFFNIGMPGFEIDAAGALPFSALVHRRDRRVQRLQPRDDPARVPVRALDERTARAHTVVCQANPSRELREHGDVCVTLVDMFEMALGGIQEETARLLLVPRPDIEEGRRARKIFQGREQAIQVERIRDGFGEGARDA